jgi:hypothetical protein
MSFGCCPQVLLVETRSRRVSDTAHRAQYNRVLRFPGCLRLARTQTLSRLFCCKCLAGGSKKCQEPFPDVTVEDKNRHEAKQRGRESFPDPDKTKGSGVSVLVSETEKRCQEPFPDLMVEDKNRYGRASMKIGSSLVSIMLAFSRRSAVHPLSLP